MDTARVAFLPGVVSQFPCCRGESYTRAGSRELRGQQRGWTRHGPWSRGYQVAACPHLPAEHGLFVPVEC